MPETTVPARITPEYRALTAARFYALADVPPELEWFQNIQNERTSAAYRLDIRDFMDCIGIERPAGFRLVTRAHVIEWRDSFKARALSPATVRRKLSALSSLYQYLCEKNAVPLNPVKGVQRPKANNNEGRRWRSVTSRPGNCCKPRPSIPLKGFATALSCLCCSSTASGGQNSARSPCATISGEKVSCTFGLRARARRSVFSRWRCTANDSFTSIWRSRSMGRIWRDRSFVR
jgi:integrase family protein with SAM-like domain